MSESKAAPGFPYDHLAILGFEKLKRYVPPARSRSKSQAPPDASKEAIPDPPPAKIDD